MKMRFNKHLIRGLEGISVLVYKACSYSGEGERNSIVYEHRTMNCTKSICIFFAACNFHFIVMRAWEQELYEKT